MQRYNADLCLLLCDIDFFKNFNDTFGHLAGDRCLNAVAETISKLLTRSGDVVSRYGGEEFTVLLPNTTRDGGMLIAERIRAAVSKIYPSADAPQFPQVTISIGVAATVPNKVDSPETLIAAADKALYRAKDQGRNTVCLADFNT